jgi:hypothetical protein
MPAPVPHIRVSAVEGRPQDGWGLPSPNPQDLGRGRGWGWNIRFSFRFQETNITFPIHHSSFFLLHFFSISLFHCGPASGKISPRSVVPFAPILQKERA